EYTSYNKLPLRFYEIDDNTLEIIKEDWRLQPAMSAYEIRWSDYIYSFHETLTFNGRKYKGQRNHINKFNRLYGKPDVRLLSDSDRDGILEMLSCYKSEHADANEFEKTELKKTIQLLDAYKELDLYAACLIIDGKYAALSIGEIVGDMLLIHVEKALRQYDGIYPTMYQEFVKLIAKQTAKSPVIINREDDSGDPGIRISKMQYHPIGRVNKYLVHINSPAARISGMPIINFENIFLTELRISDRKAYLKLNIDVENNRFWGYDYRDDEDIIGQIDENTFYDLTMTDIKAGDSLNFAIRTSADSDMIGEGIIWNFTADSAEVGCRIFPEYHGKGIGKSAFTALSDFAERELKVKVYARCYIENAASYNMILDGGYIQSHKDDKYYYFIRK
ncbi:MAG: GNAT family N-acetyltransferase, partial [Clostridia bacterium]|nr:GNAT family N-acetyltransferase [Clostridia bacterium]